MCCAVIFHTWMTHILSDFVIEEMCDSSLKGCCESIGFRDASVPSIFYYCTSLFVLILFPSQHYLVGRSSVLYSVPFTLTQTSELFSSTVPTFISSVTIEAPQRRHGTFTNTFLVRTSTKLLFSPLLHCFVCRVDSFVVSLSLSLSLSLSKAVSIISSTTSVYFILRLSLIDIVHCFAGFVHRCVVVVVSYRRSLVDRKHNRKKSTVCSP